MYDELINPGARDAGFPELKDKQEAIMSFLQGYDIFCFIANGIWQISYLFYFASGV